MLYRSMSASGAGMVMMLRCHHLGWMMMRCCKVDLFPVEPSLMDELASQNSRNHTGCVKEVIVFLSAQTKGQFTY